MATDPVFTDTPGHVCVQVATANTNRDGTGTVATILAGVAAGRKIVRVVIKAIVNTTAGMIRFYIHDGTNTRLIKEVAVNAITVGAAVPGFEYEYAPDDWFLVGTGYELRASTHNAETFNVHVWYADL